MHEIFVCMHKMCVCTYTSLFGECRMYGKDSDTRRSEGRRERSGGVPVHQHKAATANEADEVAVPFDPKGVCICMYVFMYVYIRMCVYILMCVCVFHMRAY